MIDKAERPVILAGHGVLISGAVRQLRELAEKTQTPVALTLLGIGVFPREHPLCLGMIGMHGEAYANRAVQAADLVIGIGMRFDDRVTGNLKTYSPHSKKIHIEIDRSEIAKNVHVDLPLVGDAAGVMEQLIQLVSAQQRHNWIEQIDEWADDTRARDILKRDASGKLLQPHVINDLWQATGGDAIVVSDVGQNQMWEAQYYRHSAPRSLITSGGLSRWALLCPPRWA